MFSEIVCLLFRKAQRTTEIAYIAMGSLGLTGTASSKGFYHAGIGFFFVYFVFLWRKRSIVILIVITSI